MQNYDDRDNYRDNNGKKDINDDSNAASISGSYGLIFDRNMTSWYRGGGSGENGDGTVAAAHYVSICRTIHLIYKDHSKYVP